MLTDGPVVLHRAYRLAHLISPTEAIRHPSTHDRVAKERGSTLRVARLFALMAASLAVGCGAAILLEAFAPHSAPGPFGAEDFTVAAHASSLVGILPLQACDFLNAIPRRARTAGAHLIAQHRARSALATDSPFLPISFTMAEPRKQDVNAAPALGHFIYCRQDDDWK